MAEKKTAKLAKAAEKETAFDESGIVFEDPQILRPKELPLVVKPPVGGWANDAQAEFAATLNGYAYKNPEKWEVKKDVLRAQLIEIGKNKEAIVKYRGNRGLISFKNKIIEN